MNVVVAQIFKRSRFSNEWCLGTFTRCDNPLSQGVTISLTTPTDSSPINTFVRTSLFFTTLWAKSADDKLFLSLFPPEKQDLTVYANEDNLHEMSKPVFWGVF